MKSTMIISGKALTRCGGNIILLLLCAMVHAFGTTYYVNNSGSDSNPGTMAKPWQTTNQVRNFAYSPGFQPGDSVLFAGGQTFTCTNSNSLYMQASTTRATTLTFSSYGTGQATISASGAIGLEVYVPSTGTPYLTLTVSNLIFQGDGTAANGGKAYGILVWNSNAASQGPLTFQNCTFTNFGGDGLSTGRDSGMGMFSSVTVNGCTAYNIPGKPNAPTVTSGSGISVSGAASGVMEYCTAYGNGINNTSSAGPVGLWVYDSTGFTIQYCLSYSNVTSGGDGDGFDIDHACQNCIIQYCYSHDNAGSGYANVQTAGAGPYTGNIVRYNISQNDAVKQYGAIGIAGQNTTNVFTGSQFYGNTIYCSNNPAVDIQSTTKISGCKMWNNIFITTGGQSLVDKSPTTGELQFQGNCYWSSGGAFSVAGYSSLAAWQAATGQEKLNGNPVGQSVNPQLNNPGNGQTVTATTLSSLTAYTLLSTSPLLTTGLTPAAVGATSFGTTDFYGNTLGTVYSVGADDPYATITVSASPSGGGTVTGGGSFVSGSSQTVLATPNPGYQFSNWTVNGSVVSTSASYTFTVSASTALVANFVAPPAITSASSTTFTNGQAGSFTVTATGYPAPTYSATGLPAWASLNATTGVLSGTPTATGTSSFTITASNGVGTAATQTFTLTVDQAPAITSASSTTFTDGQAGSFTVTATGYPAPTYSATGLPAWASLNATTGVLSGTPTATGTSSFTITASNGVGTAATQTFTLTVDQAPAITSANSTTFTNGQAGSFTVTATGYPAPTYSATGLPAWASLNATTGVLSGTPTATGTSSFTITASNGVGTAATQSFTLTVDQAPAITSASSTTFTNGQAGSFTVTATGYPAPTYSATGLPTWASLNAQTGVLSGTPTAAGTDTFTITASNGVGTAATQSFTLTVDQAPAITSASSTTFTNGQAGSFTVTATGYPAPTYSATGLPTWASLNAQTGVLSGTPTAAGTDTFTITASNGVGTAATQSFTLTVDQAPAITSANSTTFAYGQAGSSRLRPPVTRRRPTARRACPRGPV